jgi:hypothetical protein
VKRWTVLWVSLVPFLGDRVPIAVVRDRGGALEVEQVPWAWAGQPPLVGRLLVRLARCRTPSDLESWGVPSGDGRWAVGPCAWIDPWRDDVNVEDFDHEPPAVMRTKVRGMTREAILVALVEGPATGTEVAEKIGRTQSNALHLLKRAWNAGLLRRTGNGGHRRGGEYVWSLTETGAALAADLLE